MRRGLFRRHRAGGGPGAVLLGQFAALQVASEGAQVLPRLGLEDIDPHGVAPVRRESRPASAAGRKASPASELVVVACRRRRAAGALILVTKDQAPLLKIVR